jgi:hypothetical protein
MRTRKRERSGVFHRPMGPTLRALTDQNLRDSSMGICVKMIRGEIMAQNLAKDRGALRSFSHLAVHNEACLCCQVPTYQRLPFPLCSLVRSRQSEHTTRGVGRGSSKPAPRNAFPCSTRRRKADLIVQIPGRRQPTSTILQMTDCLRANWHLSWA